MGGICCCYKEQHMINTNQSRLRLLQNQVKLSFNTQNDQKFTYYLRMFHQHLFLQKLLNTYKNNTQKYTKDEQIYENHKNQLNLQFIELTKYIDDYQNASSELRLKIQKDQWKLQKQTKIFGNIAAGPDNACMVKLQIQSLVLVKGVSRLAIVNSYKYNNQLKKQEQCILPGVIKSQMLYRQFTFPHSLNSKIQLIIEPFSASITLDIQDLAKQQVICDIFTFKIKSQQYGYVALRMQYVTKNKKYLQQKQYRLNIIERELKFCVNGKQGLQRLSQFRSSNASRRNTVMSSEMSQYNNQYRI